MHASAWRSRHQGERGAAAGRIPNATVRTEVAFQNAQRAKREAADALRAGDAEAASRLCGGAGQALRLCERGA